VRLELLVQHRGRSAEPVPLDREHPDELPPAGHQGGQALGSGIGEGTEGGPHRFREVGEDGRVQRIGLREPPGRFGEVPDLAGVHDHHGEAGGGQRPDQGNLQAPGGLQDDERGGEGRQAGHQRGHCRVRVVHRPPIRGLVHGHFEGGLGDIDSNEDRFGVHAILLNARPCRMRARRPWRLSGLCREWP
jgi:hypothetical protein